MDRTAPFVRSAMIPQASPPRGETGLIHWLRANLFASPLDAALSVISVVVIWQILAGIGPWFLNAVWNASSLAQCREILAGESGACLAVIRDRWHQLLFGFYPSELYWRPTLALILMLVALAPILFAGVPRRLLWFSAVYPALAYWLLWGGSIWFPAVALAGFGAGWAAFRAAHAAAPIFAVPAAALGAVLWWLIAVAPLSRILSQGIPLISIVIFTLALASGIFVYRDVARGRGFWHGVVAGSVVALTIWGFIGPSIEMRWISVFGLDHTGQLGNLPFVRSDAFGGFMLSTIIGVTGIALSLPLGVLLALGRKSDMFLIKTISVGFIEFIRGVPLITLLFTASLLLNYFLPPGTNFDIVLRVIIMVTLFAAAYMAEVIRGGLAALPRGQYEAADSLGLDYWRAMRLIILPQALKISIPGIVNNFIGLFKDTTLVVFIGLLDPLGLTTAIRADSAWNGIFWELYIFVGACFFIFCFGMSRYSMHLEARLKTDHR